MRFLSALLLVAAMGCGGSHDLSSSRPEAASASVSDIRDYGDIEKYNGQHVTLTGTFAHLHGQHGILTLDSGLHVYIPHFDIFRRGDDWYKYVGKRCSAGGILHTYTKDIEGYRGPSLQIDSFSGDSD